jgi:tight adherence protein C
MSRAIIAVGALLPSLLLLGTVAGLAHQQMQRKRRLAARLLAIRRGAGEAARDDAGFAVAISTLGELIARSGVLPRATLEEMQRALAAAGWRGVRALGMFLGIKLLLMTALPLLAVTLLPQLHLSPVLRNLGIAGAAVIGLLAPDWWLAQRRAAHRRAVAAGLPDALDLMIICAEAGLGLEPSLARVAQEVRHAHPAIATELSRTLVELRVIGEGRIALMEMGSRTGLDSLKRVGATLAQTLQYGTPLGRALRVLSAEMRQEIVARFEARAARLPVLLTLPMIGFILPCIFLVVGGPAYVQIRHTLLN